MKFGEYIIESEIRSKLKVGKRIELEWSLSKSKTDIGVITGIGADYIKFKLDRDKSPHKDTSAIYFDEFDRYKVKILD